MKYNGPDRRQHAGLSENEIERIATRAKELALRDIYIAVGKSVVSKVLWVLGLAAAAVWTALQFKQ